MTTYTADDFARADFARKGDRIAALEEEKTND